MNIIILCAGFATRMYPLTRDFPKPLLEVADRPVLDYLMEQLLVLPELETIHVVTNSKFYGHFSQWCQRGEEAGKFKGIPVLIHDDGCHDNESRRGAAGDLLLGLQKIGSPGKVLVSGGDNIYRFDIYPLWQKFLHSGDHCLPVLIETELEKLQKTGVLQIDETDRVIRLFEKPEDPPSTWTSPPLYFFQPNVLQALETFLQTPGNHDAPGYFIDYLCRRQVVRAIKVFSTRLDIGCIRSYWEADRILRLN